MAKVTQEQLNRWNAKLSNGFVVDFIHYLTWGEKKAVKSIKLPDGRTRRATLEYHAQCDENRRYTGLQQPVVHLSIWENCGNDMMRSYGLGASVEVGAPQSKKNFNELAKLSATITNGKTMAWAEERIPQLNNAFVV